MTFYGTHTAPKNRKTYYEFTAKLNENKEQFFQTYTKGIKKDFKKFAIFTAGMSGVGKTEFAIALKEVDNNILHIDTDDIREFFRPIGYDGQNSNIFQKASARGFSELFSYAMKNEFSLICDSNFASIEIAEQNINRLLKRNYEVVIFYLYNNPKVCFEYAIRREVVTNRKVPKDVFIKNNENSYKTVLEIKDKFYGKIQLHFIDKRDNNIHSDIDSSTPKNLIGENYDF